MPSQEIKQFLKLVLRTWPARVLWAAGILSTVASFIPRLALSLRLAFVCIIIAALVTAWDVYQWGLREKQKERKALLHIHPYSENTVFVREFIPRQNVRTAQPDGIYIQLYLAIENKGDRDATIMRYDLDVQEVNGNYKSIKPEPRQNIQGRTVSGGGLAWGSQQGFIVQGGIIRVKAENVEGPGVLPFYLKESPPANCPTLHCTLAIHDTERNSAACVFEVPEIIVH